MLIATIQTAMVTWLRNACGLAAGKVVAANQDHSKLARPYATFKLGPLAKLGAHDSTYTSDTAGTPAAGSEITLTTGGHRDLMVSVQLYADPQGNAGAMQLAADAMAYADSPTARAVFKAAGLGDARCSPARDLTAINTTAFEGRAQFDASFYATHSVVELTGFIESVTVNAGDPNQINVPEA